MSQLLLDSIDSAKKENAPLEKSWNKIVTNYDGLQVSARNVINAQQTYATTPAVSTQNIKMLKMQKQSDILNMIQRDNNIIIYTGIGLIILALTSITIYKSGQ